MGRLGGVTHEHFSSRPERVGVGHVTAAKNSNGSATRNEIAAEPRISALSKKMQCSRVANRARRRFGIRRQE